MDGRNLSCWLLEFQEGVSHFLSVNLGDVYCYCGDEQPAPAQQSAVQLTGLMYCTVSYFLFLNDNLVISVMCGLLYNQLASKGKMVVLQS